MTISKINAGVLFKQPTFPDIEVFSMFLYNFLNIHRWFNITDIIPPSSDDGSFEPKCYSADFVSQ